MVMTAPATVRPGDAALAGADVLLYGIGAQRAGTTWLFEQLAAHSEVHLPRPFGRPKELQYWNSIRWPFEQKYRVMLTGQRTVLGSNGLSARLRARVDGTFRARREAWRAYLALLTGNPYDHAAYAAYLAAGRGSRRIVGDITPNYALLRPDTFVEMAGLHRDTRFVYVMRDPVDRLWSGLRYRYASQLRSGAMSADGLLRAMAECLANPDHPDRRFSDYAATMAALEQAVDASRIRYLLFERMLDPGGVDELGAWLGLGPLAVAPERPRNAGVAADVRLPAALAAEARRVLSSAYEAAAARLGPLPTRWLRHEARTEAATAS
jgi:hypothetical protein